MHSGTIPTLLAQNDFVHGGGNRWVLPPTSPCVLVFKQVATKLSKSRYHTSNEVCCAHWIFLAAFTGQNLWTVGQNTLFVFLKISATKRISGREKLWLCFTFPWKWCSNWTRLTYSCASYTLGRRPDTRSHTLRCVLQRSGHTHTHPHFTNDEKQNWGTRLPTRNTNDPVSRGHCARPDGAAGSTVLPSKCYTTLPSSLLSARSRIY
jgi:hypothetical protein